MTSAEREALKLAIENVQSDGTWDVVQGDEDDSWGITDTVGNAGTMSVAQMVWENDARFIAAASPEKVKSLLDLISTLELTLSNTTGRMSEIEKKLSQYRHSHGVVGECFCRCWRCREVDALLAPPPEPIPEEKK